MSSSLNMRKQFEALMIKQAIADCLQAGYVLSVNDGEETTLRKSTDPDTIFAAMQTTDEDYLLVHRVASGPGKFSNQHFAWIRFIYGNDGWDVINDYTTNLEVTLANTRALADKLEEGKWHIVMDDVVKVGACHDIRADPVHRLCVIWNCFDPND